MHPTPILMGRKRCGSRRRLRKYFLKIISRCPRHSLMSAPDSEHWRLRQLMRQITQSTCRFHLLPSRRHLRPIHGLAFTSELALALAQLSHKDFMRCGALTLPAETGAYASLPEGSRSIPRGATDRRATQGCCGPGVPPRGHFVRRSYRRLVGAH